MTDIREETNLPAVEPLRNQTLVPTPGSAVLTISLGEPDENGESVLKVEGILIGTVVFDPKNPCHRFLTVIADRLPELMAEIGGTQRERVSTTAGVAANDPTVGDDVVAG